MSETQDENKSSAQISRREFLKDAGLIVSGATIGSMAVMAACSDGAETSTVTQTATITTTKTAAGGTSTVTVTSPPVTKIVEVSTTNVINITVNGYAYEIAVEPNWTLQYLLHDVLGFIDIKTFCYRGACGSCTVIMDGRPILSCMTLAYNANGKTIETAQGIADANHPLLNSYIKHECMQCGYCTPGFISTAKALLDRNPDPTDDEIIEALSGNLCRCGTYPAHIGAIHEAAAALKGG